MKLAEHEINSTSAGPNQTRNECSNENVYELKKIGKIREFLRILKR